MGKYFHHLVNGEDEAEGGGREGRKGEPLSLTDGRCWVPLRAEGRR